MENIEPNKRADILVSRINSLNNVFEQAESVCASEIVDFIDEKTKDVSLYVEDIEPTEVIRLEVLVEDFKFTRETLRETVQNGRKVLNTVTADLLDSDEEASRTTLITSFAELVSAVNNSVKLLSASYKDISNILESMEKVRKSKLISDGGNQSNVYIDKMLVQSESISTADIIARLREKSE